MLISIVSVFPITTFICITRLVGVLWYKSMLFGHMAPVCLKRLQKNLVTFRWPKTVKTENRYENRAYVNDERSNTNTKMNIRWQQWTANNLEKLNWHKYNRFTFLVYFLVFSCSICSSQFSSFACSLIVIFLNHSLRSRNTFSRAIFCKLLFYPRNADSVIYSFIFVLWPFGLCAYYILIPTKGKIIQKLKYSKWKSKQIFFQIKLFRTGWVANISIQINHFSPSKIDMGKR